MKQTLLYILRRYLAYTFDFLLLLSFVMAFQWGLKFLTGFPSDIYLKTGLQIYLWVIFTVSLPIYAYFIIQEKRNTVTLGKKLFKLRVTDVKTDMPITWPQAFVRTFIKIAIPWEITHIALMFPTPLLSEANPEIRPLLIVANSILVLYLLVFLLSKGKITIPDLIAKTKVVDAKQMTNH